MLDLLVFLFSFRDFEEELRHYYYASIDSFFSGVITSCNSILFLTVYTLGDYVLGLLFLELDLDFLVGLFMGDPFFLSILLFYLAFSLISAIDILSNERIMLSKLSVKSLKSSIFSEIDYSNSDLQIFLIVSRLTSLFCLKNVSL